MDTDINRNKTGFSTLTIRLIAMAAMLGDHLARTILLDQGWLTLVGRLAFPLFAFLLVEGFIHTSSPRLYLVRLLTWAIIAEIPYDLMWSGKIMDPTRQNVLWTLAFGLLAMMLIHWVKNRLGNVVITGLTIALAGGFFIHLANELKLDFQGFGVMTILLFYVARSLRYSRAAQLLGLFMIHGVLMDSAPVDIPFGHYIYRIPIQLFALLALFFVWSYNGRRGRQHVLAQYAFYIFYPLHMLLLGLLALRGLGA